MIEWDGVELCRLCEQKSRGNPTVYIQTMSWRQNHAIMMAAVLVVLFLAVVVLIQPSLSMSAQDFQRFKTWMYEDPTNKHPYVNVTNDCLAFSSNLAANATQAGFKDVFMANIQANKYPQGHWIDAVLVNDDYVFIEPQADKIVSFENASITIVDPDSSEQKQWFVGRNKITVTGDMLIPVKA